MRHALAALVLLLLAAPAAAGNVACTAQHVTAGLCINTSHRLLFYSVPNSDPDGAGPRKGLAAEIADAICFFENYQPTLAEGVPNPESCADFADRRIKEHFRAQVKQHLANLKATEAAAEAEAEVVDPIP